MTTDLRILLTPLLQFSLSGSLGGDGVDTSTIIAIVAAAVSFIVAIINGIAAYYRWALQPARPGQG